jgi:quinol monooxygenase YgiN
MKIKAGLFLACCVFFATQFFSQANASGFTLISSKSNVNHPIHVVGRVTLIIPEDKKNEYNIRTAKLFEQTKAIDNPIIYTCNEDINSSGTYLWDEEWKSYEALEIHLNSKHFTDWWNWSEQFLEGDLQVKYVEVDKFKDV